MRYVEACQDGAWHLEVWPLGEPERARRLPFVCRSWRHPGECSRWKGAQDFVRIREGIGERTDWTYLVLTYPSGDYPSLRKLYVATLAHWAKFRKRFVRRWGKFDYIQTWEQHRSGYPHVNLLIGHRGFQDAARDDRLAVETRWVIPTAMSCGFGYIVWVEPMRERERMAGYLTKLARELVDSAEKGQAPLMAPRHFRRLRASRGVLPKVAKNADITGVLHSCSVVDLIRDGGNSENHIDDTRPCKV